MGNKLSGGALQLGASNTATNNFVLTASAADGTMKLARGNEGATTQDVLTVDSLGRVSLPANLVAFSVYASAVTTIGTATKVALQAKEFDTAGAFDAVTNSRFQPTVPGYYQLNGSVQFAGSVAGWVALYKNGTVYKYGNQSATGLSNPQWLVSSLVYLNGSSDYVELWGSSGGSANCVAVSSQTYLSGALLMGA